MMGTANAERFDGRRFRFGAGVGIPRELTEHLKGRGSYQPVPGSHLERVMRTKRVSHTANALTDERSMIETPGSASTSWPSRHC
jgi:hypothetical protein